MELLALTLLGGILALDGTTVGQFMVSRPMVAGFLTGTLLGSPAGGFAVGALLELYLLVSFPVGGVRFPEGAPATVVATATALSAPGPGGLALGVALGLVWGQLGGMTMTAMRKLNHRLVPSVEASRVSPGEVVRGVLAAIGLDFGRACLVTVSGVVLGRVVARAAAPLWPPAPTATEAGLLLGGAVSLGILLRSFGGLRRRGPLFAAGLLAGLAGAWVL